ncbi:MAG: hypothetical protein ACOYN7_07095 [Candidatus Nanopelagicales bacterium]
MYVLLALSSAVLYGIWEFGIGRYRRRVKVYGIILVSAIATTITYLLIGVFRHDLMLDKNDVLPGLLGALLISSQPSSRSRLLRAGKWALSPV